MQLNPLEQETRDALPLHREELLPDRPDALHGDHHLRLVQVRAGRMSLARAPGRDQDLRGPQRRVDLLQDRGLDLTGGEHAQLDGARA